MNGRTLANIGTLVFSILAVGYGQITLSNINFKKLLAVGATLRDWTTVMLLQTAPV